VHPGEDVHPGEEPYFVRRKIDRRGIVVGGFVADAEFHRERLGSSSTFFQPV
jgi:hypothetical protein